MIERRDCASEIPVDKIANTRISTGRDFYKIFTEQAKARSSNEINLEAGRVAEEVGRACSHCRYFVFCCKQ